VQTYSSASQIELTEGVTGNPKTFLGVVVGPPVCCPPFGWGEINPLGGPTPTPPPTPRPGHPASTP